MLERIFIIILICMGAHEKLRHWREKGGFTQVICAKKARMHQSVWSDIEAGKRGPSLIQAFNIERITGGHIRIIEWIPKRGIPSSGALVAAQPAAADDDAA